jgi:predicted nuclease with TOPRIM domain
MSEWEVQAINSFKNMKDNINRYLGEICEEINKKREKPKEIEDSKSKYNALQQEITLLNKTLSGERSHLELIKRENLELSDKIKKIERNNH